MWGIFDTVFGEVPYSSTFLLNDTVQNLQFTDQTPLWTNLSVWPHVIVIFNCLLVATYVDEYQLVNCLQLGTWQIVYLFADYFCTYTLFLYLW